MVHWVSNLEPHMDIIFSEVRGVLSKETSCFSEVAKLIGSPMKWGRKKPHFPIANITSPFGSFFLNPSRVHATSLIGCKIFFAYLGHALKVWSYI